MHQYLPTFEQYLAEQDSKDKDSNKPEDNEGILDVPNPTDPDEIRLELHQKANPNKPAPKRVKG